MNTNHQRIATALDHLSEGLYPYFEHSLREVYGDRWEETARASCRSQANLQSGVFRWDAQAILTVMWDTWNAAFRKSLGIIERSVVSELREFRNRWAHQTTISEDDTYRVLDSVQRLLNACHAQAEAARIEEMKLDLLRDKLGRRVNEEMARVRFNRSRLVDSAIYGICAFAIALMMIVMWGERNPMSAGFVVGFTLFVFMYLIYGRFRATPPAYGVHECGKCGKVVYTEVCPYCDPVPQYRPTVRSQPKRRSGFVESGLARVTRFVKRSTVTSK